MSGLAKRKNIELKAYQGSSELIFALQQLVEDSYPELLVSAIIHGSIATGDEISYSDVDGLLIVKDEAWESATLKRFLRSSQKLILQYDPLQHHGWFMIRESDLEAYPEDYLPSAVLEKSKLIWPKKALGISIQNKEVYDFTKGFSHLSDHVLAKVNRGWTPQNIYQLKSFLSEIMLLPCLFITAMDQAPILKELSFKAAENRYPDFNWTAMGVSSEIRSSWQYKLNSFQRLLMTQPSRFWRKVTEKKVAPKIDSRLAGKLNRDFYEQLKVLINQMKMEVKP